MRIFSFFHCVLAAITAFPALVALVTPASAGSFAYLSHTGGGSTCTMAAPCADIGIAIGIAGPNGEVICLDKGSYLSANISYSITISCGDGLWDGGALAVNTPAGSDVVIEGFVNDSRSGGGGRLFFQGQGSLHLHRVRIGGGSGAMVSHGLNFTPNGPATLQVSDSVFYSNGIVGGTSISAGINIKPAPGATADVAIVRSKFDHNRFGIIADGTGGGIIRGIVSDSFFANNTNNAITVSTTSSSVVLTVDNTKITGNAYGLVAGGGSNAGMLVRRSTINSNATGLYTTNGAVIYSYRDNSVNGNFTTDGAFTGAVNTQ